MLIIVLLSNFEILFSFQNFISALKVTSGDEIGNSDVDDVDDDDESTISGPNSMLSQSLRWT